jgi:hypothetical protein
LAKANLSLGGTYNVAALINDPTVDAFFTFDDDAAGDSPNNTI